MATTAPDIEDLARIRELAATGEAEEIRLRARMDAQPVAEAIGVARVTLRRWETRQRRPTGAAAIRYLRLLERLERVVQ